MFSTHEIDKPVQHCSQHVVGHLYLIDRQQGNWLLPPAWKHPTRLFHRQFHLPKSFRGRGETWHGWRRAIRCFPL